MCTFCTTGYTPKEERVAWARQTAQEFHRSCTQLDRAQRPMKRNFEVLFLIFITIKLSGVCSIPLPSARKQCFSSCIRVMLWKRASKSESFALNGSTKVGLEFWESWTDCFEIAAKPFWKYSIGFILVLRRSTNWNNGSSLTGTCHAPMEFTECLYWSRNWLCILIAHSNRYISRMFDNNDTYIFTFINKCSEICRTKTFVI